MIDAIFSSDTMQILQKSLNAASLQHQLITNNIANVDTPGFKASEVVFQSKLQQALDKTQNDYLRLKLTNKNHIPIVPEMTINNVEPEIVTRTETSLRTDDNNVDIDSEMSKMAENTVYYSTVAELMSLKLGMLKNVITT